MICNRCGRSLASGETVCSNCGEPVVETANQNVNNKKTSTGNGKLVTIVALVLVVVAVIVTCVLLFGNKSDDTPTPDVIEPAENINLAGYSVSFPNNYTYNVDETKLEFLDENHSMLLVLTFATGNINEYRLHIDKFQGLVDNEYSVDSEYLTYGYNQKEFMIFRFAYKGYMLDYFIAEIGENDIIMGIIYEGIKYDYYTFCSSVSKIIDSAQKVGETNRTVEELINKSEIESSLLDQLVMTTID